MFVNALKQFKQIKKDYPHNEDIVFISMRRRIMTGNSTHYIERFVYNQTNDSITCLKYGDDTIPFYCYTNYVIHFFITHGIYDIQFYNHKKYLCFVVKHYSSKDLAAIKILRYYRKYRLRTSRLRNDLVIHGLAEYWGHPSRMSFEV